MKRNSMKINRTTIKNGIAYGWTMPERPATYLEDSPLWNAVKDDEYDQAVNKARSEAIEWDDQKALKALLPKSSFKRDIGYTFIAPKRFIDGDYSHEPIDVDVKESHTPTIDPFGWTTEWTTKTVLVIKPTEK